MWKSLTLRTLLVGGSLIVGSCEGKGVESLVGSDRLPSSSALSREIIQINRGYGDVSEGFLSYELRPDDALTVTHTDRRQNRVSGEETFRLPSDIADRTRTMLWRLRPATLDGVDSHETRPVGCERRGPHDFGELAVVFVREDGPPGVDGDQIGTFELPRPDSCNTKHATEARQLVHQVLQAWPQSRVARAFAHVR